MESSWRAYISDSFLLTFGFLLLLISDTQGLSCYRCINIECNESPEICNSAKSFLLKEIDSNLYYTNGQGLPDCPDYRDLEAWKLFQYSSPNNLPCIEQSSGQATCVLGRFKIVTNIKDYNVNVTNYGTVMGCAKQQLLNRIHETGVENRKKVLPVVGCHSDLAESTLMRSLKHYLEIEHCTQLSDMCFSQSYCIHPRYSHIRKFQDTTIDDNRFSLGPFIYVAIAIGILIAILTFMGIKYG